MKRFFKIVPLFVVLLAVSNLAVVGGPDSRLTPDEVRHLAAARSIWDTGVFGESGRPSASDPVLYPMMLSPFAGVGDEPVVVLLLQVLALAVAVCVSYVLARRLGGEAAGWAAGLFLATYLPLLRMSARFLTEVQSVCLLLTALLMADFLLGSSTKKDFIRFGVATGVAFGLLSLTRVICFPLVMIPAALLAVQGLRGRRFVGVGLVGVVAAFSLTYSPWVIRNQLVFGRPIVLTEKGNNLHFRLATYWIAEFAEQGDRLRIARKKSYELVGKVAKGEIPAEPSEMPRLSSTYAKHCFFRLRVMLGIHPSLEIPFPFAGHRMMIRFKVVQWFNFLWSGLLFVGAFLGLVFAVKARRLRVFQAAIIPSALLLLYSLAHAIPRYQLVPYAGLTVIAGVGYGWLLKSRRPDERLPNGDSC